MIMEKIFNELSHPLNGCKVSVLIILFFENKIQLKYIPRFFLVLFISILFVPLRLFEAVVFNRKFKNIKIGADPIFIIGHWRSGTTHLQKLLSLDCQFGTLNTFHAISPTTSVLNLNLQKKLTSMLLPKKRPMDNMPMSIDEPHEEEFAMGNISPFAVTHGMWFPKRLRKYFEEAVLFSTKNKEKQILRWKKDYLYIVKKTYFLCNKRTLLLKNPPNTARVKILLELFPNAKFIHVYRNPFVVFSSTVRLYSKLMEKWSFNSISEKEKETIILEYYSKIMDKYLEEKSLIPENNLIEIKFEEFEKKPMEYLEKIYAKFQIPDFNKVKPVFENYLNTQRDYVKNVHSFSENSISRISMQWKRTINLWNYKAP